MNPVDVAPSAALTVTELFQTDSTALPALFTVMGFLDLTPHPRLQVTILQSRRFRILLKLLPLPALFCKTNANYNYHTPNPSVPTETNHIH